MKLWEEALRHVVPRQSVTVWWLGQAGFLLKSPAGRIIAIDPYLTDSCQALGAQHGLNMARLVPPPLAPAELAGVDLYVLTHSHEDHLNPETLDGYRKAGGTGPFLAPAETIEKLKHLGVPTDQTILTWPNHEYIVEDICIQATFAIPFAPDDLTHVGYVVTVRDGPTIYFTGDTGYHELLAQAVAPHVPDVLVTVINPAFRNLSPAEAARLAKQIDAKVVIPCHYDLFPDNSLPPQLLRTNLITEGIGERYRVLRHGVAFTYPELA